MENEAVLVDTGALAALFDPNDSYHEACTAQAVKLPLGKVFTCLPVITEACYLLRRYPVQRDELIRAVSEEEFQLLSIVSGDLPSIQHVFETYHDQDVDFADATLVHLANREEIDRVFTVDRRHFRVFRKANGRPFQLLPDDK